MERSLTEWEKFSLKRTIQNGNHSVMCAMYEEFRGMQSFVDYCTENDYDIKSIYQKVLDELNINDNDYDYDDEDYDYTLENDDFEFSCVLSSVPKPKPVLDIDEPSSWYRDDEITDPMDLPDVSMHYQLMNIYDDAVIDENEDITQRSSRYEPEEMEHQPIIHLLSNKLADTIEQCKDVDVFKMDVSDLRPRKRKISESVHETVKTIVLDLAQLHKSSENPQSDEIIPLDLPPPERVETQSTSDEMDSDFEILPAKKVKMKTGAARFPRSGMCYVSNVEYISKLEHEIEKLKFKKQYIVKKYIDKKMLLYAEGPAKVINRFELNVERILARVKMREGSDQVVIQTGSSTDDA